MVAAFLFKEERPGGPVVEELREEEACGGGGGAELGGRRYSNVSNRINSLFGIPSASTASMPVGMTATGSLELSDNMADSKLPPDKGWHCIVIKHDEGLHGAVKNEHK
jgi:hypothetical protein